MKLLFAPARGENFSCLLSFVLDIVQKSFPWDESFSDRFGANVTDAGGPHISKTVNHLELEIKGTMAEDASRVAQEQ